MVELCKIATLYRFEAVTWDGWFEWMLMDAAHADEAGMGIPIGHVKSSVAVECVPSLGV